MRKLFITEVSGELTAFLFDVDVDALSSMLQQESDSFPDALDELKDDVLTEISPSPGQLLSDIPLETFQNALINVLKTLSIEALKYFDNGEYLTCIEVGTIEIDIDDGTLAHINVNPSFQKQGIGSALIEAAVDRFGRFTVHTTMETVWAKYSLTKPGALLIQSCLEKGILKETQLYSPDGFASWHFLLSPNCYSRPYSPSTLLEWSIPSINPSKYDGLRQTSLYEFFERKELKSTHIDETESQSDGEVGMLLESYSDEEPVEYEGLSP